MNIVCAAVLPEPVDLAAAIHSAETTQVHIAAVERVIDFMRQHLNEPLQLDRLCENACISKFHFVRVFQEVTGVTPRRFLSCLRIDRAKTLLAQTSLDITAVCLEVGYNSVGTFSYTFTQLVGLSPSEYRGLPRACKPEAFRALVGRYLAAAAEHKGPMLSGEIEGPIDADGFVFIGAFTTRVPQGVPNTGTITRGAARFALPQPSLARYHLMAALVRLPASVIDCSRRLDVALVGHIAVTEPSAGRLLRLRLRPLQPTDPPLVVALPALLQPR